MPNFGSLGRRLEIGDKVYDWSDENRIGVIISEDKLEGTKFLPWFTVLFSDGEEVNLPITRWVKVEDICSGCGLPMSTQSHGWGPCS